MIPSKSAYQTYRYDNNSPAIRDNEHVIKKNINS